MDKEEVTYSDEGAMQFGKLSRPPLDCEMQYDLIFIWMGGTGSYARNLVDRVDLKETILEQGSDIHHRLYDTEEESRKCTHS